MGENIFQTIDYDEDGKIKERTEEEIINISSSKFHSSSPDFLETSKEFYYKYYTQESFQVSIYISSYAKTNQVLKKLEKKNYKAISTYRTSAGNYVERLVNERLVIICICVLGLVILLIAGILILKSLFKIRIKDYYILKFIGMKLDAIHKTCYHEILTYSIFAIALTIIIMSAIRMFNIPVIPEIMWYYTLSAYLKFFLYNILLSALAAKAFNRILKGKLQI